MSLMTASSGPEAASPSSGPGALCSLTTPSAGSFAGGLMRITELSVRLLTATHRERLAIGRSGPMTVVLADNSRRVLTVRALRSQFVQAEGQMGYITVFSVEEGSGDAAGQLVNELIASGRAQTA